MRILVTGGAGYIGSHVVRSLLESGHEPVVYDNLSTGHVEAIGQVELVQGDLRDFDTLLATVRRFRFDGAVHLAASSLVADSVRDPSAYFHNNVVSGLLLFDALVRGDVPWVVLSSTAAVYGNPETVPIPESHSVAPTNSYGESKRMLERMLHWYDQAYGLRSISLRYFNAAGAHPSGEIGEDHDPETHLIPIVLQVAMGLRPCVHVYGHDYPTPDGTPIRDYVHVCDLARAHVLAIQKLDAGGTSAVYNLGSQRGYSVLEVINVAREVTARDISVRMAPRRPGDPDVLIAKADEAETQLGWTPDHDLRDMVSSAWNWHLEHPHGYRS